MTHLPNTILHDPAFEEVAALQDRLRRWACEEALPLWSGLGRDTENGGFRERLGLDGAIDHRATRRTMVQARQIYAFSQATLMGWVDARALVSEAFDGLRTRFRSPDGMPGFVHSLHTDGSIADDRRDTYAHAFVLFALGWYYRLTKDAEALRLADEVLDFLDTLSQATGGKGFPDALPVEERRRSQNPHMHFFEAMLSLHGATGQRRYLDRGAGIFRLFESNFFDRETGSLIEHFDERFVARSGPSGALREPGHHYEWIWLLRHFEAASGTPVSHVVDPLYAHADRFGWDSGGFVISEVFADGTPAQPTRRAWPHTECIKANLVEAALGRAGALERASRAMQRLLETFLTGCHPGGWRDLFDAQGKLMVQFMPASSLYHIFCAVAEGERILGTARSASKVVA